MEHWRIFTIHLLAKDHECRAQHRHFRKYICYISNKNIVYRNQSNVKYPLSKTYKNARQKNLPGVLCIIAIGKHRHIQAIPVCCSCPH
jgi:hypothetical protein